MTSPARLRPDATLPQLLLASIVIVSAIPNDVDVRTTEVKRRVPCPEFRNTVNKSLQSHQRAVAERDPGPLRTGGDAVMPKASVAAGPPASVKTLDDRLKHIPDAGRGSDQAFGRSASLEGPPQPHNPDVDASIEHILGCLYGLQQVGA